MEMRTSIERDDTDVVDHLLANHDVVARLENLEVAVVTSAQPGHAERYAPVTERQILRAVSRVQLLVLSGRGLSLLRLGGQLRKPPIRGIGDECRAIVELAVNDPEMVVIACGRVGGLEILASLSTAI